MFVFLQMHSNPMLRSLSTDSSQKRDWKQRLSLRDNRRRDQVRVLQVDILDWTNNDVRIIVKEWFTIALFYRRKFAFVFNMSRICIRILQKSWVWGICVHVFCLFYWQIRFWIYNSKNNFYLNARIKYKWHWNSRQLITDDML